MIFLSVIIPAYNEEERLPKTLKKVRDYLDAQSYSYEVLVIDDGSTDNTKDLAEDIANSWPQLGVVSYLPNGGKGFAVRTGMLQGRGDWRLLMDADNSTDISEIEKLWKYAKNGRGSSPSLSATHSSPVSISPSANRDAGTSLGDRPSADIVIGSRYLLTDSIKIKQPLTRRIVSRLGNILVRILLGIKAADTQCGFKMFSQKATEEIFLLQTIERWGFDMEILAIAKRRGYEIKEVAVDWYDAEGSKVKRGAAWRTLKELFEIKWKMVRGKYK